MSEISVSNNYRVYETAAREEMLQFVPESAHVVLDVGCSVGNFGTLGEKVCGMGSE